MAITNSGFIVANQAVGLSVQPSGAGVTNTGTLRATNGATLTLEQGVYDNSGGLIEAFDASTVRLGSMTLIGGTLSTTGSGLIRTSGPNVILDGIASSLNNQGIFQVQSGLNVILRGTLNNTGTLEVGSFNNSPGILTVTGGSVTLEGGGSVTLSHMFGSSFVSQLTGGLPGDRLINLDNTIEGAGNIGNNAMELTNQGSIVANQPAPLSIDTTTACINSGSLRAANGGTLVLKNGTFANTGGRIEALDVSIVQLDLVTISGGTLATSGNGEIRLASVCCPYTTLDGQLTNIINTGLLNVGMSAMYAKGGIENSGTILVGTAAQPGGLWIVDGDLTLTGGGTVAFSNYGNQLGSGPGARRLINANNTIRGAGDFGLESLNITNQGMIIADQPTSLRIWRGTMDMINSGTLRAVDGATMTLQVGGIDNVGGTIEGLNSSVVELDYVNVTGGQLNTSGSGVVRAIHGGTYSNITNAGTFETSNPGATLQGVIDNRGLILVGQSSTLYVSGSGITLTGGGLVHLIGGFNSAVAGGGQLTNINNVIRGGGNIFLPSLVNHRAIVADEAVVSLNISGSTLDNQGALEANGGGGLNLYCESFTTSGSVTVAPASQLMRSGVYSQSAGATTVAGVLSVTEGYIQSGGVTTLQGGTITGQGTLELQDGTLMGEGTVELALANSGTLAPGLSPGTLNVTQSYGQAETGELSIEIGGLVAGDEFDVLNVAGAATLGGTIRVSIVNGFQPQAGDTFTILTAASVSGTFDHVITPCLPGLQFQTSYGADAVVLSVVSGPPLRGDMDCSCVVDIDDISHFVQAMVEPDEYQLQHPGCNISHADMNQDDREDGLDIEMFVNGLLMP